ncbi:helix-turn-helix domain-containing protein [Arcobacter sp. CECT 8986]|uniref:helix-turn-helix domain-containing protein n=1 Tax=Arcobacter sp. CECT 8986 TaxID=2044507 RepID=UPI002159C552|nr:helix-turn-helix transcriptional regulator [Arcobacter sp. CECT 8986]
MSIDKYKVKELMAKKEIKTQSELADLLGISKNQLSNILSDEFDPIKSNVRKIADFFDISPLSIIKDKKEKD